MKSQCQHCNGTGQKSSPISGQPYACRRCAGLGWAPAGVEPVWFYRPRRPRPNGGVYARTERISVMQRWGDKWRLTSFDQSGPVFHREHADPSELMDDLVGYIPSSAAPRLLDFWATRPAWAEGLKMMAEVQEWNSQWQKRSHDEDA